jgi:methylated-DNA-protein-cysteine methyltransferase-like protein
VVPATARRLALYCAQISIVRKLEAMGEKSDIGYRERVYKIVRRIPRGRVMTYGQLAEILGDGYTPRTIGFVMHGSDDRTPWHRVVNAQGGCSTGRVVLPHDKQQRMLEAEGITFDKRGRCELKAYLWIPPLTKAQREGPRKKPTLFTN